MHIIQIFYQIFSYFDNFDLIFGPPLLFFPFFFQLIITYHVYFIPDYPHFIIFSVFFLGVDDSLEMYTRYRTDPKRKNRKSNRTES